MGNIIACKGVSSSSAFGLPERSIVAEARECYLLSRGGEKMSRLGIV